MHVRALWANAAELIDRNETIVAFPGKEGLVREAIRLFQNFLREPVSYREQWTFLDMKGSDRSEVGYFRRDDNGEHKSFFHSCPCLYHLLNERRVDWKRHAEFCRASLQLFYQCEQLMLLFVRALDEVSPGYGLSMLAEHVSSLQMNTLRLLSYDRALGGSTIANWHTDRSFLTLHIDDSRPALRLREERNLHRCAPERALIFPGDTAVRTRLGLRPVRHAAIEQSQNALSVKEGRWSAVFFLNINTGLIA